MTDERASPGFRLRLTARAEDVDELHHLYEYGNCPFFATIGRRKEVLAPDGAGGVQTRTVCSVKYTFDERVEDGLYCATGLELLKGMVEDPEAHGAALPADAAPARLENGTG